LGNISTQLLHLTQVVEWNDNAHQYVWFDHGMQGSFIDWEHLSYHKKVSWDHLDVLANIQPLWKEKVLHMTLLLLFFV
jgi:aryl-phospho-beta-D-glucosidase BglC (GH1 family)